MRPAADDVSLPSGPIATVAPELIGVFRASTGLGSIPAGVASAVAGELIGVSRALGTAISVRTAAVGCGRNGVGAASRDDPAQPAR